MLTKQIGSLFLLTLLLCSCEGNKEQIQCSKVENRCQGKEECLKDPNCLCWCSQICNWRKKTPEDNPTYIENDPHGKFCYCKQWDYDHYEDNCILHKGVKEPKGAK